MGMIRGQRGDITKGGGEIITPIIRITAESMVHVDTTARDDPEQVWNDVTLVWIIHTNVGGNGGRNEEGFC